jgi:hypothetical protein
MEGSRRDIRTHIPPKADGPAPTKPPPKPSSSSDGLSFDEKEKLVRLFMEIRQQAASPIGMLEVRNLLSRLFEDFKAVRDPDIDVLIKQLAEDQSENNYNTHPDQLQL